MHSLFQITFRPFKKYWYACSSQCYICKWGRGESKSSKDFYYLRRKYGTVRGNTIGKQIQKKGLSGTHVTKCTDPKGSNEPRGSVVLKRYLGEHLLFGSGDVTLKLAFRALSTFPKVSLTRPFVLSGHLPSDTMLISSNFHIYSR